MPDKWHRCPFGRLRLAGVLAAAFAGSLALAACGGSGGSDTALERAELIGDYDVVLFVVKRDGITDVLDLLGDVDLVLEADGTTSGRLLVPEGVPGITEGTGPVEADLQGTWTYFPGVIDGTLNRVAFDFAAGTFLEQVTLRALPFGSTVTISTIDDLGDVRVELDLVKGGGRRFSIDGRLF